jgi:hypothetical protein
MCCKAFSLNCLACAAGLTEDEFCGNDPEHEVCTVDDNEPKMCCKAMTASCLACAKGITVKKYCKENPETVGCDKDKGDVKGIGGKGDLSDRICCEAMTADCLACSAG